VTFCTKLQPLLSVTAGVATAVAPFGVVAAGVIETVTPAAPAPSAPVTETMIMPVSVLLMRLLGAMTVEDTTGLVVPAPG
jgi:hypothetical protein